VFTSEGDPDTGIYFAADNSLRFTCGGTLAYLFSSAYMRVPDGSAGAPGCSFLSDTDTGMYRLSTNVLGFACGGVDQLNINSSGQLNLRTDGEIINGVGEEIHFNPTTNAVNLFAGGAYVAGVRAGSGFLVTATDDLVLSSGTTDGVQLDETGEINASTNNIVNIQVRRRGAGATANWMQFFHGGTASGLIGGTSGGTPAFSASSDVRLKTEITEVDVSESGGVVDAVVPKRFRKMGGDLQVGVIAQEFQQVLPAQVFEMDAQLSEGLPELAEGAPPYLGASPVSVELVMHMLVTIKDLRARVAALEGA
jgi:hypothetical protein